MNNNYTYDYIKNTVILLKENMIYRMNDSINLPYNHKINQEILHNDKYNNSILKYTIEYKKRTNWNKNKYNFLLDETIKYMFHNNISICDSNTLIVHLRLGDIVSRIKKQLPKLMININEYIKEHNINNIIIITAFHFGHPQNSNKFYNKGQFSYTDELYDENINFLLEFIKNIKNIPVNIQSNNNIDNDFCSLISCKHLITSGGGFGTLITTINKMYNSDNIINSNNIDFLKNQITEIKKKAQEEIDYIKYKCELETTKIYNKINSLYKYNYPENQTNTVKKKKGINNTFFLTNLKNK